MNRKIVVVLAATVILSTPSILLAQYTLVLKNGGKLTVQSYREEGQVTRVYSSEGELAIPRDQIQSIVRAGENQQPGAEFRGEGSIEGEAGQGEQRASGQPPRQRSEAPAPDQSIAKDESRAESPPEVKPNEEEEYRKRVIDLTQKLRAARDRYALATRGSTGPEPSVPFYDEQIKARNDDLISRMRDVQQIQSKARFESGIELPTPYGMTGEPPPLLKPGPIVERPTVGVAPEYTEKQRELSDLRNQIYQLEQERQKLIDEMKQKNFDTADLFLD
ncbi:MAG TPA: hypothetical protein VGL11_04055 [Candidatus Binatia bacterium]|jgi:hypothetical protein